MVKAHELPRRVRGRTEHGWCSIRCPFFEANAVEDNGDWCHCYTAKGGTESALITDPKTGYIVPGPACPCPKNVR